MLTIELADAAGLSMAQHLVTQHHYLRTPVDPRCRPLAYLVKLHIDRPLLGFSLLPGGMTVGCLIFGRPEATRCYPWFGSVEDVQTRRARLSRWEIVNLARVWLAPDIQQSGRYYVANAATWAIGRALKRLPFDYLTAHPPCFVEEPWELRECISYCDTRRHRGTIYRAANFALVRENGRGMQTWARPLRALRSVERSQIGKIADQHPRSRIYRSQRSVQATQEAMQL